MFEFMLQIVLAVALSTVHSASRITPSEWTLIADVQAALTALLAKRPQ